MNLELGWSGQLQEALKNDGFLLYFQPIVAVNELQAGMSVGPRKTPGTRLALHYEVLVRLKGAHDEVIAPGAFLPTAERFRPHDPD